ncbi:hypothetical protein O988_04423 [Pseudogymnoascus sp. VKM F-3808]|nr:hypothetical protein O988_04423 [Pseudogymnoascus sp. VKM F-3808]
MHWLFGYDCSTIAIYCCVDDKDAASTVGFCCRYGEKASIKQSVPKITVTTEQPRTTLHPAMIAALQFDRTHQESSVPPSQNIATLSLPTATDRKRALPEMTPSEFMPSHPLDPMTRRKPSPRQQQSSYDMPSTERQPSPRQQQSPYELTPAQRQQSPRQHPSSRGLLDNTPVTAPEQIAALNMKLEAYRQIIVDLMKPAVGQQEPAVSAEQLRTSLRKAVSNPYPRTTAAPYPETPPCPPSPKLNAVTQSQSKSERFELPATSQSQSSSPPRDITPPPYAPYVNRNPYRNRNPGLSAATSNHHRTASQPQMDRPKWPATPDPSRTPSITLNSKELPRSAPEEPKEACDSMGVPIPTGCCVLDPKTIRRGLGLMAEYLHQNNADLTVIAVGGVVSTLFLRAWSTTTDVDALGTTLTTDQRRLLASAASYAKTRGPLPLGDGWFSGQGMKYLRPEVARHVNELSMQQNDVVFCSEGLTVLAPRWSYAFMLCVDRLSHGVGRPYDMGNAVVYLHRYIETGRHKLIPILGIMKWGEGYDLHVTLGVLRVVKAQYLGHYKREGISE